ncbi:DUF1015 family protein [Candidatus Poriferisodalis sp.]|uniref:DUF1015 family protein n=1 Tax=Candidatus Poriferisodalis sp. TaxID=3101277 RepID=UPI003B0262DA
MIEPVRARVLVPEWAPTVIPAPYDSLTPDEHARRLAENPDSFAHVAGVPAGSSGHPSEHRRHATRSTQALNRLIGLGAFGDTRAPSLYVQRVEADDCVQHALLGCVRLDAHELRPHEDTQPGRVHGLAVHFSEVGCMSSPVVVTAPRLTAVAAVIEATLAAAEPVESRGSAESNRSSTPLAPLLDTKTVDGARVTLWPAVVAGGEGAGVGLDGPLYIVDGHHRVAAARQAGFSHVLVACAPAEELHLGSFDRELSELHLMPRRVMEMMSVRCDMEEVPDAAAARPRTPGWIGLGVAGRWYRARVRDAGLGSSVSPVPNPATRLDAAFVHDCVLGEIFGVESASDPRIAYRPAAAATSAAPVTILLAPVLLDSVFEVADFGAVMPPKTTCFLPKARSGLLLVRC